MDNEDLIDLSNTKYGSIFELYKDYEKAIERNEGEKYLSDLKIKMDILLQNEYFKRKFIEAFTPPMNITHMAGQDYSSFAPDYKNRKMRRFNKFKNK